MKPADSTALVKLLADIEAWPCSHGQALNSGADGGEFRLAAMFGGDIQWSGCPVCDESTAENNRDLADLRIAVFQQIVDSVLRFKLRRAEARILALERERDEALRTLTDLRRTVGRAYGIVRAAEVKQ